MQIDYTMFYIEANIVCIILFAIMLYREAATVGRQAKQVVFINLAISYILYFSSDIIWVLILGEVIPRTQFTASLVNYSNAILLSAITACWFIYVELSQGVSYITIFKNRIIAFIPAMAEVVIMAVFFIFFPSLALTADYEMSDLYYVFFITIPTLYIIASSVRSFMRAFKKENYAVRTQYILCAVYPVVITIFGIIQTMWLEAPVFCFGCTIMMVYIYIISLNDQVSIDELTRLNNRTQLTKYIMSEHTRPGGDRATHYVLMIDLNKFKQINDVYGHVEGDMALRRTADALKVACAGLTIRSFIARYGGDEFIVILKTDDEPTITALCTSIKNTLVKMNSDAAAAYELTASVGYASYVGDIKEFQSAVAKADEALYEDKKAGRAGQK
ncbi:MAG: GGDEF domain-containing protein [Clostridiales bacterium]|nr:GGDEF domain-containing protein [Clostridiales bacterium]